MVEVIAGFSLTNRLLLYASFLLSPGQAITGVGSNLPTNIGFLAYNWYNQCVWYSAIKKNQLHALSLLPIHFNTIYAITYLGGVTSGNIFLGLFLSFGTAALIIFNTVAAWMSWASNMSEGYHVYQFYFFGWRMLTPGWHKFFLLWQIGDTILAINCVVQAFIISVTVARIDPDSDGPPPWWSTYTAYAIGSLGVLFIGWDLILWVELIVSRNHIESPTDMIAVYLFIGQIGTMLLPAIVHFTKKVILCLDDLPVSSRRADNTLPLVNQEDRSRL